jgi:hypothetical protein
LELLTETADCVGWFVFALGSTLIAGPDIVVMGTMVTVLVCGAAVEVGTVNGVNEGAGSCVTFTVIGVDAASQRSQANDHRQTKDRKQANDHKQANGTDQQSLACLLPCPCGCENCLAGGPFLLGGGICAAATHASAKLEIKLTSILIPTRDWLIEFLD